MKVDLESPEYYINRELSWCEFNHRVLEEAMEAGNPLLERLRFASIVASNLDEFFMVRVAGLKRNVASGNQAPCVAGYTPSETLQALSDRIHRMFSHLYETISQLLPQAAAHGISIQSYESLNPKQVSFVENRFENEIFPVLTPLAIDPKHPFPMLSNLSLSIAVMLSGEEENSDPRFALVPIPSVLTRLLPLPSPTGTHHFILLEEIARKFIDRLFTGQQILEHAIVRITRDAEMELDDEGASDLVQSMEGELRKRRTNPPVRLEVEKGISESLLQVLLKLFRIQKSEIYSYPLFLDCRVLSNLADLPGFDHLRYKSFPPQIPVEFEQVSSIWPLLREKDLLLHHPYESFEPVVQLLSQAADDPEVLAIKQTLYRTSGDSPVVRALARAAQNGKQVSVLVELTARFDEERNITWARHLEKSGAHVIYGVVGLKTHAKILLIVRREKDGIRRYVHLGTGNYNDRTARLYSDIGMLTSDEDIGADASGFFNTITGFSDPPEFNKLTMAPLGLRERFLHLIRREAARAQSGQMGVIRAKMNSLVDPLIIRALYEASQAGVQIRLGVRGICCLRPGVKGVSENISVMSIVDRFLEHTRIFYFNNGGEEEYYCSSADWMPRNLDRRVELLFPVSSTEAKTKLRDALQIFFSDNVKARVLNSDGNYSHRKRKKNEELIRSQEALYQLAIQQRDQSRTFIWKPLTVPPPA